MIIERIINIRYSQHRGILLLISLYLEVRNGFLLGLLYLHQKQGFPIFHGSRRTVVASDWLRPVPLHPVPHSQDHPHGVGRHEGGAWLLSNLWSENLSVVEKHTQKEDIHVFNTIRGRKECQAGMILAWISQEIPLFWRNQDA